MRFLDTSRVRVRLDQRVSATDGTELSVDLYLPPEPGRYPVLLNCTPADNNRAGRAGTSPTENNPAGNAGIYWPPAERWKALAAQGYVVAAADVRGRGDSDGAFIPFVHEASDGAAIAAWLRKFDEFSGKIGVFGSGYGAFCAWATAVADGNIDAIASISPFGAVGKGLVHRGGVVRLDWLFWMHLIGGRSIQPANVPPWPRIHRSLPLNTLHEALGREDIWWRDWMDHLEAADPFWASLELADKIAALKTPGLHVTGAWDGQLAAAHYYYEAARRGAAPQQWILGPWSTATVRRPASQLGGFDFGPRAMLDLDEVLVEFFDACLRSQPSALPESRVFFTGRNEWVRGACPLIESGETLQLHLSSALGANTRRGDGTLSSEWPANDCVDISTHNPAVPVEFQPQFMSFAAGANRLGFTLDQGHVTARDEALVYTSAPLEKTVTVHGVPRVTLTVRTTAADADIHVLISDSFPRGTRDLHLRHASVRLATVKAFKPGTPLTLELALDVLAHDFLKGHQIRLTVCPSLFPLYARNLQISEYASGLEPVIADVEVHHGPHSASSLTLPLVATPLNIDRQGLAMECRAARSLQSM